MKRLIVSFERRIESRVNGLANSERCARSRVVEARTGMTHLTLVTFLLNEEERTGAKLILPAGITEAGIEAAMAEARRRVRTRGVRAMAEARSVPSAPASGVQLVTRRRIPKGLAKAKPRPEGISIAAMCDVVGCFHAGLAAIVKDRGERKVRLCEKHFQVRRARARLDGHEISRVL